jgi:hypothetical protein
MHAIQVGGLMTCNALTPRIADLAEESEKADIHFSSDGYFDPTNEGTIFGKWHRRPLELAGRFGIGIRDGWSLGHVLCVNHTELQA